MSNEHLMEMLKTLCTYQNVEIKYTASIYDQPKLVVRCLKDTTIIEITNIALNTTIYLEDPDMAVETIQSILN